MYGKMLSKDVSFSNAMNEPLTDEEKEHVYHTYNAIDMRQGAPKGTDMYTLYEQSIQGWSKLPDHLLDITVRELEEIMDDGLTNGFEFRLQGSTILFREVHH